jgi:zinc transport system substrate-binding protein
MKKLSLLTLITLVLFGCQNNIQNQDTSSTLKSEQISLVTSFYPLTFLTENIVREKGDVINLAGNTDVHEYRPSPQDIIKLNRANLVIVQGAELEPWTHDMIPQLQEKGISVVQVAEHLELHTMADEHHHEHEHHETEDHEEDHHHGEEDDHHEEEEHHHHGEFDPHTWLDPVLAQSMIETITQSLKDVDSSNSDYYQKNANHLKQQFITLDNAYRSGISHCERDEVITSHDAFGYLARRYGFEVHSIAGMSTHDEPSAHTLATLKEEAEEGITHILTEQSNITRFAETLSSETGLQMLPLNPLGRGTLDPEKDFFDIMNENLQAFKTALGCE